jgi:ATP-binding cassette subfamily F protein uup
LIREYEDARSESARSGILLGQIEHFDGWNLEHRIKSLIPNLHAPDPERSVSTVSGGEKRRVALCRALLARPDFLILDEPTNHLDTGSIEWLEDFLARYSGTCLFVTHDRYFLDRIATRVIELSRGKFYSYDGNYTDYLLARAERARDRRDAGAQAPAFLKRELAWVRSAGAGQNQSIGWSYFELAARKLRRRSLRWI